MEIATKLVPLVLALIMLGLGLGLTTKDFLRVINFPRDFIVGFICQLVILPIVAYVLIIILKTPVELALGVMIIAAAPGGVTTNVMTKFAKGDVALSISLTAVISLISIISVPFIILQSAKLLDITIAKDITMIKIALQMACIVAVPVILGMIVRKYAENFVVSKISIIEKITGILFLILFVGIWIEERENILSYIKQAGLITLILNVVMMFIAYYLAKFFATGIKQRKTISIECGLQNGTLALAVAKMIFEENEKMFEVVIVPTATYALLMYITAFIFMYIVRNSR